MRSLTRQSLRSVLFSWLLVAAALLLAQAAVLPVLKQSRLFATYYAISSFVLLVLVIGVAIRNAVQSEQALSDVSARLIQAQEAERTRIARELHDDISQRLALTVIEIDRLKANIPRSNSTFIKRMDHLRNCTEEIANDVQSLSHQLHSPKLEHLGLVVAIRAFCQNYSENHNLQIEFRCHDVPRNLPSGVALCLFRVFQEAVHNARKHSKAPRVDVHCWGTYHAIYLTVIDAGVGFAVASADRGQGLGLTSMRERVKLVNGTISIASELAHGTEIRVQIPVEVPLATCANTAPEKTAPPCGNALLTE
jgi:signal transduction histidine kinase